MTMVPFDRRVVTCPAARKKGTRRGRSLRVIGLSLSVKSKFGRLQPFGLEVLQEATPQNGFRFGPRDH